jgi:hypothetical protein
LFQPSLPQIEAHLIQRFAEEWAQDKVTPFLVSRGAVREEVIVIALRCGIVTGRTAALRGGRVQSLGPFPGEEWAQAKVVLLPTGFCFFTLKP